MKHYQNRLLDVNVIRQRQSVCALFGDLTHPSRGGFILKVAGLETHPNNPCLCGIYLQLP